MANPAQTDSDGDNIGDACDPSSPPVAVNDVYSFNEDTTLTVSASPGLLSNDTDANGNPLRAILVAGPATGTLRLKPDGSFTYKPIANFSGGVSFTYKANDGSADSNVATVLLTVTAVNDLPVARSDSYTVLQNTVLNVAAPGILGNDTDVDGNALTAILVSGPSGGTLALNPNGSFSYTPPANFVGRSSFSYRATDGPANSGIVEVTITVKRK